MPRATLLVLFLVGEESGRKASFFSMLCRCEATKLLFRSWSPGPEVHCEHCGAWHSLHDANDPLRYFVKVSKQTMRELRLLAGLDEKALTDSAPARSDAPPPGDSDQGSGQGSDLI